MAKYRVGEAFKRMNKLKNNPEFIKKQKLNNKKYYEKLVKSLNKRCKICNKLLNPTNQIGFCKNHFSDYLKRRREEYAKN